MISTGYTAHQWVNVGDRNDPNILWNISFIIQVEKSVSQAAFNFVVFAEAVASKRFVSLPANIKRYQFGFSISDTMSFFAPDIASIIHHHVKEGITKHQDMFNAETSNSAHFDVVGIANELTQAALERIGERRFVPKYRPWMDSPKLPNPIPELERMLDYG